MTGNEDSNQIHSTLIINKDSNKSPLTLAGDKDISQLPLTLTDDKDTSQLPRTLAHDKDTSQLPLTFADDKDTSQLHLTLAGEKAIQSLISNTNHHNDEEFDYDEDVFGQNVCGLDSKRTVNETIVIKTNEENPCAVINDIRKVPALNLSVKQAIINSQSDGSSIDSDGGDELKKAQKDWNDVEEVTATGTDTGSCVKSSSDISFFEALHHLQSIDLQEYADKIRPCVKHSGCSAIWHYIVGPPKLQDTLPRDRDLIFTLALVTFDNADTRHLDILRTIYKRLTSTRINCARYGGHWEIIGFQGNDPATDLRGCGMLGLLTTLHFITAPKTINLSRSVYLLSQDEVGNFPFSVMSINVTRISLQILREGKLNRECNQRSKVKSVYGAVLDVFLDLHAAIFRRIYHIWKTENKTMLDSGFVLKDVEDFAKQHPIELLRDFTKFVGKPKSENTEISHGGNKIENFVGIEDLT